MNQLYPSYNDIVPSWADIKVTLTVGGGDLLDMIDIAALKDNRKLEFGEQRGASGGRVMGRTTGQESTEGSITLYRSGHLRLLRALKAVAPQRGNQRIIGVVAFDVLLQHTPPGSVEIYSRKWKSCRIAGDGLDLKEGVEADKVEIPLNIMQIADLVDGEEVVLL